MIRQVEQYHGIALARLVGGELAVTVGARSHEDYCSVYTVNDSVALYVKYSTSRLSPWTFGFKVEHQGEIRDLRARFDDIFVTLVCGLDGIACLACAEYQRVLDDDPKSGEWIKVRRGPRQKYAVSGSDGRTICKIGDNEYPAKVLGAVRAAKVQGRPSEVMFTE